MNEPIDGYDPQRWISDRRFVGVVPLTFGRARIVIGDRWGVSDSW